MLLFRKPSPATIESFLRKQSAFEFTYPAVGATATEPPAGYRVGRLRTQLGQGEADFLAAKHALERWEQFQLGWMEPGSTTTPIRAGEPVAFMARSFGQWWLNACRIVYVIPDDGPTRRFGFAYGSLPDHVASGEERFLIEWDPQTNTVTYDILVFSRPRHFLAHLGGPLFRASQEGFRKCSAAAMQRAVNTSRG